MYMSGQQHFYNRLHKIFLLESLILVPCKTSPDCRPRSGNLSTSFMLTIYSTTHSCSLTDWYMYLLCQEEQRNVISWMSLYTNTTRIRRRLTYHNDVLCLEKFLCLNSYLFKLLLNTGTCMCPHCTIYKLKVTPLQS